MKKAIIPFCILILVGLGIFLYINRFTDYGYIEIDGYALNDNTIYTNLSNFKESNKVTYEKVSNSDKIYKSNTNYYIGEKEKKSINIDYPIVSKDVTTLFIADDIGEYITSDFDSERTYANTMIVDEKLYNTTDYEQATFETYYFLLLDNGIYINLADIKIKTYNDEITIPSNSFLKLNETSLNYYYILDDEFTYVSYPIIDKSSNVTIDEYTSTYEKLLEKLLSTQEKKTEEDENTSKKDTKDEEELNTDDSKEKSTEDISSEIEDTNPEYIKKEENTKKEKVWEAPTITINSTYSKTYTYRGIINIHDPSGTLTKMPTFEFSLDGNVVLRKTLNTNGSFIISGLLPSKKYTVVAYYEYVDQNNVKRQKKIKFNNSDYSDSFTTLSINDLNSLDFNIKNVTTTASSFNIEELSLNNTNDDEVLYGIKSVIIDANDNSFTFTSSQIRNLSNLVKFSYTSAEILDSNTNYNAKFKVLDTAGNILKLSNNTFTFRTKQCAPKTVLSVKTTKNFTKAELNLKINNNDNVNVSNYKYIVYDENNNEFSFSKVYDSVENYTIVGLDTAKKYTIKVYCSYTTNENYYYENEEIGSIEFISYDIEKLGNISFTANLNKSQENYITSSSASLNISYASYDSKDPLYDLINNNIEVKIIEKETNEVILSYDVSKYDFITGKDLDISETENTKLKSNTEYSVELSAYVTSGNKDIPIKTTVNGTGFSFSTLKLEPYVSLSNIYIASGYIDFDAYVIDIDKSILNEEDAVSENVTLEIYNSSNNKVYSKSINISHTNNPEELILNRVTIDTLDANDTYKFNFKASNYYDNFNAETNKVLDGSTEFALFGLETSIEIKEMIKTANYKLESETNLFDLSDVTRWKSVYANTYNRGEVITSKVEENTLTLSADNGYRVYSYYLPELVNQDITLSYEVKRGTDVTSTTVCIMNAVSNNTSNCIANTNYTNTEFGERQSISFKLNSSGYISFYIGEVELASSITSLIFKDFQIEIGTTSSDYKSYSSSGYVGNFKASGIERYIASDENENNNVNLGVYEYFVSLSYDNQRINTYKIDLEDQSFSSNDGVTIDTISFDNIIKDKNYTLSFSVYDTSLDRYYDLNIVNFETDAEIRVIKTISDFLNMHKNGYYIAINDLDFTQTGSVYSNSFDGILDMQGHSIKLASNNRSYLFHTIGGGGIIRNADIHYYVNNTTAKSYHYGLFYQNYGTVENSIYTLEESTNVANYYFSLWGWVNYGTIDGFVFHCKANLYGFKAIALGVNANYGTIKNGYAYADDGIYGIDVSSKIPDTDSSVKDTGVIARSCSNGSITENIYSTIRIYIGEEPNDKDKKVGSIAYSISYSTVRNIYVYDSNVSGEEKRDTTKDIMFYSVNNMNYSNLYYISDVVYSGVYSKAQLLTALKNVTFQNNTINSDKRFLTEEAWRLSVFPLLDYDVNMPVQEYVSLPSITTNDLKFIDVDKIEYLDGDYEAQITLSFYNPKKYTIKSVTISDIGNISLVGKASTNSDNITTAIFKIKNISTYKSFYTLNIVSTTSGSLELNALMEMDMYQNISSLNEITNLDTNYKLTSDITEYTTTNAYVLNKFKGKLNGDNHTITNMSVGKCFIYELQGTLSNINFVNFKNTSSTDRAGIACYLDSNGKMNNVYSKDETLVMSGSNTSYVGGLVAQVNSGSIINSAVNGLTITTSDTCIPRVGGLVGYGDNVVIDTSLARNVNINSNANPNDDAAIGGIIGYFNSGKVTNIYSTGNIKSKIQYLGGICGQIRGETATIKSAISAVDIKGEQDYIGGIVGSSQSKNNVSKTIALNDIATTKADYSYFDRTSGTIINRSRNFAWDKQSINNIINANTNGEVLLSQEELYNPVVYSSKIGFGSQWVLDENFRTGYIPYLISSDDVIIKGQGYYEDEDKSEEGLSDVRILYDEIFSLVDMQIETESTVYTAGHQGDPYFIESYVVNLTLSNAHLYQISSISADGIDISFHNGNGFSTDTKNNTSSVKLDIKPSSDTTKRRYYDSYILNQIKYNNGTENKTLDSYIVLNLPFYGVIDSVDDWKNVEQGYYENFIITNDIDFTGASTNDISIKSFNNLIGVGENMPVLSNITANFTKSGQCFIDTIVSKIQNIKFDTVLISNTSSGNYVGLIKYQNGYMYDMEYNNITINAPNMSYAGVICINQSPRIKTIKVKDLTITGLSYLGFISRTKSLPISYVSLNGVTINSSQTSRTNYIGGLIGYDYWKSNGTYTTYISGNNITINAPKSYYVGGLFGYASGCNVSISNSDITGFQYVGGIVGNPSKYTNDYNYVFNSEVNGTNYVGGVVGYSTYLYYSVVYNSTINGSYRTGGMAGYSPWETIQVNSSIKNKINGGEQTGGIIGSTNSTTVQYNSVKDSIVKGTKYVGGITGGTVDNSDNTIRYNSTNATVTATTKYAGGILGYDYNRNTTSSRYRTRIYDNIVAGSIITSADYGAGLVGGVDTTETFFTDQYYRNLIDAQITCDTVYCKYLVGNSDNVGSMFQRIHVYEGSLVKIKNGTTYTSVVPKTSYVAGPNGTIVTKARLQNKAFYGSGANNLYLQGFTIDTRTSNLLYYPRPSSTVNTFNNNNIKTLFETINNDSEYLHKDINITLDDEEDENTTITNMRYLPLPSNRQELVSSSLVSLINVTSTYHELPNATVYVSGVDTINIDFDKIDEECILVINEKEYYINDYTMTFKYDFNSTLTFMLTDEIKNRKYDYEPNDIRNSIYTINSNYYYIKDNKVLSNKPININNAVNIYNGLILLDDKNIYDIDTSNIVNNTYENLYKTDKKCLLESNYLNQNIKTYYLYSLVNNEYYEGQIFIKNDKLEVIDYNLNNKKDKLIIDNYNDNDFLIYLSNDGVLHSLKDNIKYPNNFLNTNIKDINSNILNNTDLLFVLYNDGNYIIFNYKTGTLILNSNLINTSIVNFAINKYNNTFNSEDLNKPISTNYENAVNLVNKIGNSSINEMIDNENINNDDITSYNSSDTSNYIIKYDYKKNDYEVIELSNTSSNNNTSLINELNDESVQNKINSSKKLSDYYNIKINMSKSILSNNEIMILFIAIGTFIASLIIILGNIVMKSKRIGRN